MSVADKGYEMSNYGLKTYNPDQVKEMWRENICKENKIARSHKATTMASETKKVCYLVIFSRRVKINKRTAHDHSTVRLLPQAFL